ncbi:histidine phosphatase family protein [Leptolyngbya boryana CZ1]|uniref:Histidine phosphatase family protein n=1 Tax=Leptolyngbya boryana CZ1 TaxID=3060204 RepID=A0AA97AU12_LEPBY|nr:histidine phosphatase family protein [Leptolyngbya boryana]WNZ43796.1 histidine phosphatase family protein [Leptolyngbya boryana CZ1]
MVTRVILVRHGQSTYNLEKRYQGCCDDSVLTARGLEMATQTGELLRNTEIHAVYSSPLKRTRQSAIAILNALELELELNSHENLKEIEMPAWEGLTFQHVRQNLAEDYQCWKERPHEFQMQRTMAYESNQSGSVTTLTQSESHCFPVLELYAQAHYFWKEVLPRHLDETILIVSHGGTIRALIGTAIGIGCESFHTLQQSNCGISVLDFPQGLQQPAQLKAMNVTQHLGEAIPKLKEGKLGLRLLLASAQDQNSIHQLVQLLEPIKLDLYLNCESDDVLAQALLKHHSESTVHLKSAQCDFFDIWHQKLQANSNRAESLTTALAIVQPEAIRRVLAQTLTVPYNPAIFSLKPGTLSILHYPVHHRPVLQALNFSNPL